MPQHAPLLAPSAGGSPFSRGSQPYTGASTQPTARALSDSGAAPRASAAGGGKPMAAPAKAKPGGRADAAMPAGIDLAESDLRGYVIECAP